MSRSRYVCPVSPELWGDVYAFQCFNRYQFLFNALLDVHNYINKSQNLEKTVQ